MLPTLVVLAAGRARRFGGCKPLAPVGPQGEAIVDLLASDAQVAGFGRIVMVVNPDTGPRLRDHVRRMWPEWVEVAFAEQACPLGTVDAVLTARPLVRGPFAVANADDCYGADALRLAAGALDLGLSDAATAGTGSPHVTVAFSLERTLLGGGRVNRGICDVDAQGYLRRLVERREVGLEADGTVTCHDGRGPDRIAGDAPTAVNLWGFQPSVWDLFDRAMEEASSGPLDGSGQPAIEVLIPEVIGKGLHDPDDRHASVRVLRSDGRCIGVTHPGDLGAVRDELSRDAALGHREPAWSAGTAMQAVV